MKPRRIELERVQEMVAAEGFKCRIMMSSSISKLEIRLPEISCPVNDFQRGEEIVLVAKVQPELVSNNSIYLDILSINNYAILPISQMHMLFR